jgi:hypothetical protein
MSSKGNSKTFPTNHRKNKAKYLMYIFFFFLYIFGLIFRRLYIYILVMGIGNIFKIDDRYINIDR